MKSKFMLITLLVCFLGTECYAVDLSIYHGKWETTNPTKHIEIDIKAIHKKPTVEVYIDGNKLKNTRFEFVYGENDTIYPFLQIIAEGAEDSQEDLEVFEGHYIYLTIGKTSIGEKFNIMRGFYEYTVYKKPVIKEELDIKSYPIELIRAGKTMK